MKGGSMSVVLARPVVDELGRRNLDPAGVLRAAGLSRQGLQTPENRLPVERVHALWEEAAAATGDPSFGVHLAQTLPLGALDVIDYLFACSKNVAAGLARVAEYSRLIEDPPRNRFVVEPLIARVIRCGPVAMPQLDEFGLALTCVRTRQATGGAWKPERVEFRHGAPGPRREVDRVFGCPVVFGASESELVFPRRMLDLPFDRADSRLLRILEAYASSLVGGPQREETIAAKAMHAIALELPAALPTLANTAAALRLSPRTLQRRLRDSGTAHSELVDQVRRSLALKYVGDAGLSITEIGYILHFSDTTAFSRAFKRWTGVLPRRYRERVLFDQMSPQARARRAS